MIKRDAWRDYTRIRLDDIQFQYIFGLLKERPELADSLGYVVSANMRPWDFQRINHIELVECAV